MCIFLVFVVLECCGVDSLSTFRDVNPVVEGQENETEIYIYIYIFKFCTITNKCTIISQIITVLHVSTLLCHPQGACNQYFAKLQKYFKCRYW